MYTCEVDISNATDTVGKKNVYLCHNLDRLMKQGDTQLRMLAEF